MTVMQPDLRRKKKFERLTDAQLLTIISGSNKENAARQLLMSDVITSHCPVTLVKLHPDSTVILTEELAAKIGYVG